jgi:phosphodiesterase/alkaline phosphatase D-like protein
MTNLYGSTPDPTTNVFPDITKDLDGDGIGDGYEAFYNNESKLIKDASVQGGYYIQRTQIGSFFEVTALGGIEKGGNTVSFYAKGDVGTELQVQVTTNGQQTNYSVFLTSADWTKYQTTITIPQATILADVKIVLKNTVAPTYTIAISDWKLSKSVKSPITNILSNKTITDKQTLPLSAEPGCSNYLWNSGETTQDITFDGAKYGPGTFPVSYTSDDPSGALVADNAKITVTGAKASVSMISLDAKGATKTFDITANIPWTLSSKNGLAITNPTSEPSALLNTKTITVTMADNSSLNPVEDVINIITAQGVLAIPVTQKGIDPLMATTNDASGITITAATLNAQVNASNTTATVTFEYGLNTNYGTTIDGTPVTVTGSTPTAITAALTGLTSNTTYNYRVNAVNLNGPVYGSNIVFKTLPDLPAIPVTNSAYDLLQTSFTANWGSTNKALGYRLDVASDNTFTTILSDYNNKDVGNHTSASVTGLSANTPYYYRVRAYNGDGDSPNSTMITATTLPVPPPAPAIDAASSVFLTSFTAKWSSAATATSYKLDISTDINFTTFLGDYNNKEIGNITNLNVSGLSPNTTYYYRIRAHNIGGDSPNSTILTVTTLPNPPIAPVVNSANNVSQTSFAANWNSAEKATDYILDIATDNTFNSILSDYKNKEVGNSTSFNVIGLGSNTTYYYRVKAHNAGGESPYSNTITVITLPDPPAVPAANPASNAIQTGFTANWGSAATATSYKLDVATDNAFTTFVANYQDKEVVNVMSFEVTGLSANTTYYYRVRAHNPGGDSPNSTIISVTTLPIPPAMPTDLSATTILQQSFVANWGSITTATGYRLDVATDNAFTAFVSDIKNKDMGTTLNFNVTGLQANTTYYYRLTAYNRGGLSAVSNTYTVITLPNPPAAPNALAALDTTQTSFTANWSNPARATGYLLDVSTEQGFTTYLSEFKGKDVGDLLNYKVTGLDANTIYYYRVRAYNTGGMSADSITIKVTTLPVPPVAPTANAATTIHQTTATANWSSSATATGYRMDIAKDDTFTALVTGYMNKDLGNTDSIPVTGLSANKMYYYRLRAYNTGGTSPNSNTISFTTLHIAPPAPRNIITTAIVQTSFSITWNTVDTTSGYKLDIATDLAFNNTLANFNNKDLGNVTTYPVTGLSANKTYYFRVKAYNNGGNSTDATPYAVTTLPNPPPTPIATPASKIAQTYFTANWNKLDSATAYHILIASDSLFLNHIKNDSVGAVTSYDATGLTAKTQYYYKVIAKNTGGSSGTSNIIKVKTLSIAPPAPSLVSVKSCDNIVTIKWKKSTGLDIDRYRIYYYKSNTSIPNPKTDSLEYDTKDTIKTITSLTTNTQYYFFVKAINQDGSSSIKSNELTETVRTGVIPIISSKFGKILICSNVGNLIQSYQWIKDGVIIPNATSQYYSLNKQTGNFQVSIIDKYGCTHPSNKIAITGLKSLQAFPNPTAESFSLKVNDESEGKTVVTVFNTSGIKVIEFQTESLKNELLKEISVRNLNAGVYVVQVLFNNEDFYYTKVIVKK